jgi:hypothetical protein
MLRHVVLLRWKPGTTPAQLESLERALAAMQSHCPTLRAYRYGRDAGLVEGNFSFAIVADCDDAAGFRAYAANAYHQQVIAEQIRPILESRAAAQFELGP